MFQIDTDTAVAVRPAPAAPGVAGWFSGGNPGPGTPVPATNFSPDWCNIMQGELLSIIAAAGLAADKTAIDQVLKAIKQLIQQAAGSYIADTGAANALAIAPANAPAVYVGGETWRVIPAFVNTGAATINRNGIGLKSMVKPDGSALAAGDIPAAGLIEITYQAALGKFILLSATNAVNASQFASSIGFSGYQKLPSGLILQWAAYSLTPTQTTNCPAGSIWGQATVNWPLSFPNGAYTGWAGPRVSNNGQYTFAEVDALTATNCIVYHNTWGTATFPVSGTVFALGN